MQAGYAIANFSIRNVQPPLKSRNRSSPNCHVRRSFWGERNNRAKTRDHLPVGLAPHATVYLAGVTALRRSPCVLPIRLPTATKVALAFSMGPGRGGVVAVMFRNFFAALRFRAALRDLDAPERNSRAGAPQQAKGAYLHCLTRVAKTVVYCFPSAEFGSTSSRPSITLVYSGPICCASVSALVPRASSALLSFF